MDADRNGANGSRRSRYGDQRERTRGWYPPAPNHAQRYPPQSVSGYDAYAEPSTWAGSSSRAYADRSWDTRGYEQAPRGWDAAQQPPTDRRVGYERSQWSQPQQRGWESSSEPRTALKRGTWDREPAQWDRQPEQYRSEQSIDRQSNVGRHQPHHYPQHQSYHISDDSQGSKKRKRRTATSQEHSNDRPRSYSAQQRSNRTSHHGGAAVAPRKHRHRKSSLSRSPSHSRSRSRSRSRSAVHSRSRSRSLDSRDSSPQRNHTKRRARSPQDNNSPIKDDGHSRQHKRTLLSKQTRRSSRSPQSSRGRARHRSPSVSSYSSGSRSRSRSSGPPEMDRRRVHRLPGAVGNGIEIVKNGHSRVSVLAPIRVNERHVLDVLNAFKPVTSLKMPAQDHSPPSPDRGPSFNLRASGGTTSPLLDSSPPDPLSNRNKRSGGGSSNLMKQFFPGDDDEEVMEIKPTSSKEIRSNGGGWQRIDGGSPTRKESGALPTAPDRQLEQNSTHNETAPSDPVALREPPSEPPTSQMELDVAPSDTRSETLLVTRIPSTGPTSETPVPTAALPSKETAVGKGKEKGLKPPRDGELYTIVSQVGEGTFGQVYKAVHAQSGAKVALKRIRMEGEKDGFPVTAMREIKLLQSLRHENVVKLHEMMVSKNGSVYMVFEYMDHDLTGILSQQQFQFSDAHLKSLSHQMLAGVAYLHQKGVIHRDMKGSNILINNQGVLKLADFGLARFYQKRRRTDYTNRVITLWYRPPELLLGATVYGPEVDMWSVGCIILELYVKKPIFQGNDEIHQLEMIWKVLGTPSVEDWPGFAELPWYELVKPRQKINNHFRSAFQKYLSPAALDLVQQLLEYDPAKRITAAEALETPFFKVETPEKVLPIDLACLDGEWHEYESKRERERERSKQKKRKADAAANVPKEPEPAAGA